MIQERMWYNLEFDLEVVEFYYRYPEGSVAMAENYCQKPPSQYGRTSQKTCKEYHQTIAIQVSGSKSSEETRDIKIL